MWCNGELLTNDFGCPLLTITSNVKCASSVCLDIAVSIVHECTTCQFVELNLPRCIERERVSLIPAFVQICHTYMTGQTNFVHLIFIVCINNHTFVLLVSQYVSHISPNVCYFIFIHYYFQSIYYRNNYY